MTTRPDGTARDWVSGTSTARLSGTRAMTLALARSRWLSPQRSSKTPLTRISPSRTASPFCTAARPSVTAMLTIWPSRAATTLAGTLVSIFWGGTVRSRTSSVAVVPRMLSAAHERSSTLSWTSSWISRASSPLLRTPRLTPSSSSAWSSTWLSTRSFPCTSTTHTNCWVTAKKAMKSAAPAATPILRR